MRRIGIYTLIICGLFYFSEGKPCPEKTRPHKTRCEAYYKCMELPSKKHVWIPEKCEQGLIYEHNLKLCVLPGDDWECTLGDNTLEKYNKQSSNNSQTIGLKDADIYIVNNKNEDITPISLAPNDGNVEVIVNDNLSSEEEPDDAQIESSGDGGELVELDGFLRAEDRETEDHMLDKPIAEHESEHEHEATPTPSTTTSASSNIDPKLTAHLQRLSQLIDGLKQTYQNGGEPQQELRPDQLNAFLAHFNIKNKFNLITPSVDTDIKSIPNKLSTTTTAAPIESTTTIDLLKMATKNKTLLQEHLNSKLEPETKVVLTNALPKRYANSGYSNSQIVVNRPEGSVLFALPTSYGNEQHFSEHNAEYNSHSSPKISEETLKTVLELSKQMIATQNIPKIIPNPAYYTQPILQPLFIPASAFNQQPHGSPFSSYFNSNNNNNNNDNDDYDDNDGKYNPSSAAYSKPHGYKKAQRPGGTYNKPGTTIIHNNVIPVHVTSTSSGEKEIVDSYGQSVGVYPPLKFGETGNSNSNSNGYQSQTINHQHIHSHRFENNKFISSVTTVRPSISTTQPNNYVGQYPSPYPSELSITTARPFDFQTTPTTISEFYTPSPHLDENNANSLFQPSDRYPTIPYGNIPRPMDLNRPSAAQQHTQQAHYYQPTNPNTLFPTQLDPNKVKIRPNAHKYESIEEEADEIGTAYNDEPAQQQVLTYNYNNEKPDLSTQYVNPMLSFTNSGSHKRPYMPRPQAGTTATGSAFSTSSSSNSNKPKFPAFSTHSQSSYSDDTQLINVGGNFISFDVFQKTILPLLGHSQSLSDLNNVEVITCAPGVRQPNITDCTRYYVCSKKDGKVLSYSCPPYTAFNSHSRICDAHTYSVCTPEAIVSSYTVSENKRIQLEAIKALQDAKRRQEQALKAQNVANVLQQYSSQNTNEQYDNAEKDMLSSYVQQAASMSVFSTTTKPSTAPAKKRKYYCKEGDKIADQTSINNYFVCYKNAQGMMKGHKMTCSKGLLFCPKTSVCTLPAKCA